MAHLWGKIRRPWWCVAALLVVYLLYLAWLEPVHLFGRFHDDTIYFSTAKALAEGRGYVIPSFPGNPSQTKYPVFYPWLLSWIWQCCPSFPANLYPAWWMTALFGCWFLVASFQFLRRLGGLGDWPALLLVSLCAFHPVFLGFSANVLSDVPFAALALTAAVAADSAMRRAGPSHLAIAGGILAGLSAATRAIGVTVVAGILAAALYRRAYRQAILFCLAAAPFLAVGLLLGGSSTHLLLLEGAASAEPGWRQTVSDYTGYWPLWRLGVPSFKILLIVLKINLGLVLTAPARYLLFPVIGMGSLPGIAVYFPLAAGAFAGVFRQARGDEWKPIHFVLFFYAAGLLPWNYPQVGRLLFLFLPLFYAGFWVEGRRIVSLVLEHLQPARSASDKALAAAFGLAVLAVAGTATWNYLEGDQARLRRVFMERAAIAPEKMQAYQWLKQNTDQDTRIVAYEDAGLYLYTGRQSVRPITFLFQGVYTGDTKILQRDLAHITDVARHIGARFWLTADDDFEFEAGRPIIQRRVAELTSALPEVFRSRENKVQIYDLTCLLQPQRAECKAVIPILFPPSEAHEQEHQAN